MYVLTILNTKTREEQYVAKDGRTGTQDVTKAMIARSAKHLEGFHRKLTRALFRTGYFVHFKRI